jgi:uncharacterized membrane protein
MAGERSVPDARDDRERLAVMLAYGLYLLAITNGVTALVGFIVALELDWSLQPTHVHPIGIRGFPPQQ